MASYQPIFDLRTDWVAGVQVLDAQPGDARRSLGRLRMLPPTTFVVVEETGPAFDAAVRALPATRLIVRVERRSFERRLPLPRGLRRFRAAGGRLAADASLGSLRRIARLGPHLLYLDPQDTHLIDREPASRTGAIGLVAAAIEMGAAVVATRIETRSELDALRGIGVSYGQGPLLAEPRAVAGPADASAA